MKTALKQAERSAEDSTPLRLRRPKCRSDNNLFRQKAKRPAPSDTSESLSQAPGKGRKQGTTPDLSTETTAEEQQSVLEEYLAEVRQLKRLKRNVSKGLLTLFPRTKVLQRHGARSVSLKGAYQRDQWVRAYMGRMQSVMKEMDRSLERYRGS